MPPFLFWARGWGRLFHWGCGVRQGACGSVGPEHALQDRPGGELDQESQQESGRGEICCGEEQAAICGL